MTMRGSGCWRPRKRKRVSRLFNSSRDTKSNAGVGRSPMLVVLYTKSAKSVMTRLTASEPLCFHQAGRRSKTLRVFRLGMKEKRISACDDADRSGDTFANAGQANKGIIRVQETGAWRKPFIICRPMARDEDCSCARISRALRNAPGWPRFNDIPALA